MNFKITQLEPDGKVVTYKQLEYQPVKENQLFTIEIHDDTVDGPSFYLMRVGKRLKEVVGDRGENFSSFEDIVKSLVSSKHFMNTVIVNRAYIVIDTVDDIVTPEMIEYVQHICLGRRYKFILNDGKMQLNISI